MARPRRITDDAEPYREFMEDSGPHPLRPPLTRTDEGEPLLQMPQRFRIPNTVDPMDRQRAQSRLLRPRRERDDSI